VEQLQLFLGLLYTASQVQELLRLLLRQAVAALLNTLLLLAVQDQEEATAVAVEQVAIEIALLAKQVVVAEVLNLHYL
tara:strand:+ start:92 stop:325 length:234 start_codon:yes stop_codon:yes gene_type:complete